MAAKKKITDTLGLDAAMAAVEAVGSKKLAATVAAMPPPKPQLHTDAEKALQKGRIIPLLTFESKLNAYQNIHTQALHHFYTLAHRAYVCEGVSVEVATKVYEAAVEALKTYPLTGTNTYAKAMARYRQVLLAGVDTTYIEKTLKDPDPPALTPLPPRSRVKGVAQGELPLEGVQTAETPTPVIGVDVAPPGGDETVVLVGTSLADIEPVHDFAEAAAPAAPYLDGPDDSTVVPVGGEIEVEAVAFNPHIDSFELDDDPNVDPPAPEPDTSDIPEAGPEFFEKAKLTFPTKADAKAHAVKEMGPEAIEGMDYKLEKTGKRWAVTMLEPI